MPIYKQAIRDIINGINAITNKPLDKEFDKIIKYTELTESEIKDIQEKL